MRLAIIFSVSINNFKINERRKIMKLKLSLTIIGTSAILFSACAHQDAAKVGAAIGHGLGTPIGVAVTAVDETIQTTIDIVNANPRYTENQENKNKGKNQNHHDRGVFFLGHENDTHYYKAEVLVKTNGPADIDSIDFHESEEVTDFWE